MFASSDNCDFQNFIKFEIGTMHVAAITFVYLVKPCHRSGPSNNFTLDCGLATEAAISVTTWLNNQVVDTVSCSTTQVVRF